MHNCTYRSVYFKMWVTDSHIIQHWKFIKDKETVIILYTNNQGHIKAKDEGSSLLGCYTMFTGKQLPMFGRIIVHSSSEFSSPRLPINSVTSPKTWTVINTAMRTSNLTNIKMFGRKCVCGKSNLIEHYESTLFLKSLCCDKN